MKVSMRLQRSILRGIFAALAALFAAPLALAADPDATGLVPTIHLSFDGQNLNYSDCSGTCSFTKEGTETYAVSTNGYAIDTSKFTPYGNLSNVFTANHDKSIAVLATLGSNSTGIMIHFKNGSTELLLRRGTTAGSVVLTQGSSTSPLISVQNIDASDSAYHLYVVNILQDRVDLYIDANLKGTTATTPWAVAFVNWQLGGRHGGSKTGESKNGGLLDDIRAYSSALTVAQMKGLAASLNFSFDDMLTVSCSPAGVGSPSPSGATTGLVAGQTVAVSCGTTPVANAAGTIQYSCAGWKLYDENDSLVDSGATTSFTYAHPSPAKSRVLEWQWAATSVKGTITASSGGSVSPSGEAWYAVDTPVTVTATPDSGKVFFRWTGTLPAGIDAQSATATFTPSAPFEMTAVFATMAEFHVAKTGDDENGDGSQGNPFATISNALAKANAAITGGTADAAAIRVAAGTYNENMLLLTNAVSIIGAGSATNAEDSVILQPAKLDGENTYAVRLEHEDALLENVKVRVASRTFNKNGYNVYLVNGTVRGCWVAGNGEAKDNLYMTGGLVEDTKISDGNRVNWENPSDGINVYASGGRIRRCLVTGGFGGNSVRLTGTAVMENSLVTKTTNYRRSTTELRTDYYWGWAVKVTGSAQLVNCTVADNTCYLQETSGGVQTPDNGGVWVGSSSASVVNCVIYGNDCSKTALEWGNANATRFFGCAVPETAANGLTNATANGNIAASDADFTSVAAGLFQPSAGSRLIDAGADLASYGEFSATDFDGNARRSPASAPVDIGCYEADQDSLSCGFTVSAEAAPNGVGVVFTPAVYGAGSAEVTCRWDFDDGGSAVVTSLAPYTHAFATAKMHTVTLSVSTDGGSSWIASHTHISPILTAPADIWLDGANASGAAHPYDTEATAATSLADVVGMLTNTLSAGATALDGVTIHVKPGTYAEYGFILGSGVTVKGEGGDRSAVVFDAGLQGYAFYLKHSGATLSGITVTNGKSMTTTPAGSTSTWRTASSPIRSSLAAHTRGRGIPVPASTCTWPVAVSSAASSAARAGTTRGTTPKPSAWTAG